MGRDSGTSSAGFRSVSIGYEAGRTNSLTDPNNSGQLSVNIGGQAGYQNAAYGSLNIGYRAGYINPGYASVNLGVLAGSQSTSSYTINIGYSTGVTSAGANAISIGYEAGTNSASARSINIGEQAGNNNAGLDTVNIGRTAGDFGGVNSVNIGVDAGDSSGVDSVNIGDNAGTNSGVQSVNIGFGANSIGNQGVHIGGGSGFTNAGLSTTGVGYGTGQSNQAQGATAIGFTAGTANQGTGAVAVGNGAGYSNQGNFAVALGTAAGTNNQAQNSIIINASGSVLDTETPNSLSIDPIREITEATNTNFALVHDSVTKEVTRVSRENFLATIPSAGNSGFGRIFEFGGFTNAAPVIGQVVILGSDIKFHQIDDEGLPIDLGTFNETESGAARSTVETNFDAMLYQYNGTTWELVRFYSLNRIETAQYGGVTGVLATVRREVYSGPVLNAGAKLRVKLAPFW